MFLKNAWYVAAWDHEVAADSGQVQGIRLLDQMIAAENGNA